MIPGPRERLLAIFQAALAAVHGRTRVREFLRCHPLPAHPPVYVIAFGKAACAMVQGAYDALGDTIRDALIITKRGYGERLPWPVLEAGHPVPDAASLEAGAKLEAFIRAMPEEALVLVLLSGGASTLVELPPCGVTLADLERLNRWLLGAGLDIRAMNAVRSCLSRIKGGRLAQWLHPRRVLGLAISDVPGDDPRVIGSGPLVADGERAVAWQHLALPPDLRALLARRGMPAACGVSPSGVVEEGFDIPSRVKMEIIATNADARQAAAEAARAAGFDVGVEPTLFLGDAIEAGRSLANRLLRTASGTLYIWGGETTVRLPPQPGRGGRCQSLALSAALTMAGQQVYLLAAGTDGTDGPCEDAGALVDGGTVARGAQQGLDAAQCLARADAGAFLEASGDLVHTGPTGTNVMDLMLGVRID